MNCERPPATMRVAVMYAAGDIRIEERPLPRLEPGDVLVRTAASGVCSGDLMPWYVRKKAPFVFGHEPAGTVVATGGGPQPTARAARIAPGDRVFAHHHAPCLHCAACSAGNYVHCATWRASALEPGGMAEYFRVPSVNLADTLVLPDGVSFADGSLVEPLACVVKSLRRAFPGELRRRAAHDGSSAGGGIAAEFATAPLAGRTLYVVGAGVMGLMHVALGAALGARVFASDFHASRRAAACRLGAVAAFAPADAVAGLEAATHGARADVVVCGPGTPAALDHAAALTADAGTLLMFTPIDPQERFAFDQSRAYFRDLSLVSSYSCGPGDTRDALGAIAAGVIDAARLEAREFVFPAVAEAYAAMASAACLKAIVAFEVP